MVAPRLLLLWLMLGTVAGCRLEPSPQGPPPVELEAPPSEAHSVSAAPSAAQALPPSDPQTTASPPEERQRLAVTIAGESLRLDAEAVRAVEQREDPFMGPMIVLVLREGAAESFARMTGANRGKQAVVTLDGRVLTSLAIMERIVGGRLPIPIEASEASDLEIQIRAATGTLPTI